MKLVFENKSVAEVFFKYPAPIREKLLILRQLIFDTATKTKGVGALEETLKWGEPSYLTSETKSGSTIRIHSVRNHPNEYALYFNCKTTLIETFREKFPTKLRFSGNRAILFDVQEKLPLHLIKECLVMALTYNQTKSTRVSASKQKR
jgi:hypothetical protein